MAINSCLYEVNIWHDRHSPKRYTFEHKIFMFYLDLDEASQFSKINWLMGCNQWRVYNFKDEDHILSYGDTAKASILAYVKEKGLLQEVSKVKLLTNLRTFGYIFNPVSFYFCFDKSNNPLCVVVQIGNTFGELKDFYLGGDKRSEETFRDKQTKYYYISPFTDLDSSLDFKIQVPDERLNIKIDVVKNKERFFNSSMLGEKFSLSTWNLLKATIKYPLITFKVIFYIHWHAAILHFIKRIPHYAKEENPHNQKEVYRPWKKK